jgi:hypothetical protein
MAGSQKSFSFNADTLVKNLDLLPQRMERVIIAAIEYHATRGEAALRKGARWTDRTSNARNGLFTATSHSRTKHTITFYHSVPYGIWLEVRWAGRYAIIMPTVRSEGALLMKTLDKAMARIK